MADPDDLSTAGPLNYHQFEPPTRWSMHGVASTVGWCSFGLSVLLFIDPYLPQLHVLMLIPLGGALGGLVLAGLAAQVKKNRKAAMLAMIPNVLAVFIPALSMLARWLLPVPRQ